jgi:DNA-binding NarL/FixJ family response regulator
MLVQREKSIAQLESALECSAAGNTTLVLIEGAVGCGKSELVETVSARAAGGDHIVLRAVGTEADRTVPLGVISQLVRNAPEGALPDPAQFEQPAGSEAMHAFAAALVRLSEQAPIVLCVDDIHQLDELSSRYLFHLAGFRRSARILMVLVQLLHERSADPLFGTELLRQPNFSRIRLERLDRAGVGQLAEGAGEFETDQLHAVSGGNPLLLRALLQDTGPRASGPFAQAVLACLYRCGAATTRLAEGIAVLDGAGNPDLLAELLGTSAATVAQGIAALTAAGLLDGLAFRHPVARAAVLERMDPAARLAEHRRAAELAWRRDEPAVVVAAQLMAAHHTGGEWGAGVLRSAADQYLAGGAAGCAAEALELALAATDDPGRRTELRLRLAEVAWHTDPGAAERQLAELMTAPREDGLPPAHLGRLARLLVTQGRVQEAAEVLEDLHAGRAADTPPAAGWEEARRTDPLDGLSAFPQWTGGRGQALAEPGAARRRPPRVDPAVLWALPDRGEEVSVARTAELFLRGASLAEGTVEPVIQALRALLYLGGAQRAVPLCAGFVEQARRRDATGWYAALSGVHAEALMRQGDLAGATREASAVLVATPQWSDSMLLTGVAATLVRAHVAAGRPEQAAALLSRSVPSGLGGTVHGLAYLRARGQYLMLTSRFHAALGDFLDVGRQLKRWGLDRPRATPWRTDAAEALLRLGEAQQAERFIVDQLATRDGQDPWVRGVSLRVRAAAQEPRERQVTLAKAIDELRRSGDRYELACALAEFGRTLKETGDLARAGMVNRRAWHLAHTCGADALRERIMPGHTEEPAAVAEPAAARPDVLSSLSDSEQRVAVLAVHGHTNREIALKLYITVSTVEQHLTRVYRKLGIAGRQQLPMDLQLGVLEPA